MPDIGLVALKIIGGSRGGARGALPPPGGWKVPLLIEGPDSYQPEVNFPSWKPQLAPAERVKVPPNDLGPPGQNFLYPTM